MSTTGSPTTPVRRLAPSLLLVALWLGLVVAAFSWAPQHDVDGKLLRDDLRQHRVTAFTTTAVPPPDAWAMVLGAGQPGTAEGYLVWQVEGSDRRYTHGTTAGATLGEFGQPDGTPTASDLAGVQGGMARVSGITTVGMGAPTLVRGTQIALFLVALACVALRTPRTGTRWFWFWIIGIPGGIGVLLFAATELWRTGPLGEDRHRGGLGFLVALVAGTALQTLVHVAA